MDTCVKNHLNYAQYRDFVLECAASNTTSGANPTPERIKATKLNAQRMQRIEKQVEIEGRLKLLLESLKRPLRWLVITEAWCGDSAQCIPVIAKIARCSPRINDEYMMRDEQDALIEKYNTNGARAIPKLICFDAISDEELWTWGPRPLELQKIAKKLKADNPAILHEDFLQQIHFWYAKDKGMSLQSDIFQLLVNISK